MPGKTCVASRATEAELENAVSRELMRDPKAGDPENLSNRRKVELGERPRRDFGYSLREIIDFLKVPRNLYELHQKEDGRAH